MTHSSIIHRSAFAATAAVLLTSNMATPQPPRSTSARPRAKLEAVAETKLLMEGLLLPNFKGLERNLRQRPADDTAWTFARSSADRGRNGKSIAAAAAEVVGSGHMDR